ncbi:MULTISPECIES: glycosyltransferase [Olivibacter]|uniref:Glycosyltransferase n=2 Tax=Olivibacter TaxID=376469 RepID=A0ABV6HKT3_9SPHI|nr:MULTISPECIES: glycosyltransferase [Olivibacter]MCL4641284.1 glycosyltransferase family 4 protein [Olivibacter sp. UJ_SKK_5.1]MDM8175523.1 glycosyltransferase [Olivibacter sp. 47]MDX3914132.1 glycosyltransferase [Pseudosphingobacterium sp.]QEL02274.1 glycosyltransferase family 4 protein [Olivibacter sp. LS-1]
MQIISQKPLRILTWHIHGSYLYYLSQVPCQFYLPVMSDRPEGYGGRSGTFKWGDNVYEVPVSELKDMDFDCILFQSRKNYLEDQYEILDERQRVLPKIYLEHDPPREVPTDTRHIVDDPEVLLIHVTHFNNLMWDNNRTPTRVIQHGVLIPKDVNYTGVLEKGVVVINGIAKRGRRLGYDIFKQVQKYVPLDLIGMESEVAGGLGEIAPPELPSFISKYRFFFNPIRYTSLGLAVCESMMVGLPIIGLATTEMAMTVDNGKSGYIHTDVSYLINKMQLLLDDPLHAKKLGDNARETAIQNFGMDRFIRDWLDAFELVIEKSMQLRQSNQTNY